MTIAQLLKHDFKSKDSLYFYDSNGKEIYYENSNGYWLNVNMMTMVMNLF
jgi:hypothetical protein